MTLKNPLTQQPKPAHATAQGTRLKRAQGATPFVQRRGSLAQVGAADACKIEIGGGGEEDGKFRTPHGLTLDDRPCAAGEEAQLLVCDRENHRLQWFTLKGQFVRKLSEGLRRPCNAWILRGHGMEGWLAIADLTGCVTILDQEDKLVTVLGDNAPKDQRATNGVGRESWQPGRFFAPHSVCQDATGALYVMDWNATGRVSKLELVR